MYADDCTMYYASPSCDELNNTLSSELNVIFNWIETNKLKLNISKTVSIIFGSNYYMARNPILNLQIDGQLIQYVRKVKLLGLWLDNTLSWSEHINKIVLKMGRAVAIVRKCAPFIPSSLLCQTVHSLVLCHLDYCSVIWSSASKQLIRKLQVAQNKAARLILNCPSLTSTIDMHCNLGWLCVEKRILMNLLVNLYSVVKKRSPHFLAQNIIYTNEIHSHSTRAASNEHIILPYPKTNFLKKSVLYRATSLWNLLPRYIHKARDRNCFKRKLRAHLTMI